MIGGLLWLIFGGWQELKLPKHLAKPPSGVECAAVQDAKVHLEVTPVDISIPSIDATPLLEQNGLRRLDIRNRRMARPPFEVDEKDIDHMLTYLLPNLLDWLTKELRSWTRDELIKTRFLDDSNPYLEALAVHWYMVFPSNLAGRGFRTAVTSLADIYMVIAASHHDLTPECDKDDHEFVGLNHPQRPYLIDAGEHDTIESICDYNYRNIDIAAEQSLVLLRLRKFLNNARPTSVTEFGMLNAFCDYREEIEHNYKEMKGHESCFPITFLDDSELDPLYTRMQQFPEAPSRTTPPRSQKIIQCCELHKKEIDNIFIFVDTSVEDINDRLSGPNAAIGQEKKAQIEAVQAMASLTAAPAQAVEEPVAHLPLGLLSDLEYATAQNKLFLEATRAAQLGYSVAPFPGSPTVPQCFNSHNNDALHHSHWSLMKLDRAVVKSEFGGAEDAKMAAYVNHATSAPARDIPACLFTQSLIVRLKDYDLCPVSVEPADVIVELRQSGSQRAILIQKVHVRKDLPGDPHLFATSREGTAAAYALQEYQADDEQITRFDSVMAIELPRFENGLMLKDLLPDRTFHLHENSGPHEDAVKLVLYRLHSRGYQELYEWNRIHSPGEIEETNEYAYGGLEHEDIVEIWNRLCEGRPTKWISEELHEEGLLNPENEFGNNPEYLYAKLLMWQKRHGICGLEAIIRHCIERMRVLCRPSTHFLSALYENVLNVDSSDWPRRPGGLDVREDSQYFDKLHAEEVDFEARKSLCIESWRACIDEVLPNNLFNTGEGREQAYHALLEYQDDREAGTEEHAEIEHWARPVYMSHSPPLEVPANTEKSGGLQAHGKSFSTVSASPAQFLAPSPHLPSPQHLGEDETMETEQIKASSRAMQTKTSSQTSTIPVIFDLSPTSSHTSGGLMEYIKNTQEDGMIDPADPIFAGSKVISRPSVCLLAYAAVDSVLAAHKPTARSTAGGLMEYIMASREDDMNDWTESILASRNVGGGVPSPKMITSFLRKKASNAPQTGIKAPLGIDASYPEAENVTYFQELGTHTDAKYDTGLCDSGRAPVGLWSSPSACARLCNPSERWPSSPFSRQSSRNTELPPHCLLESQPRIPVDDYFCGKQIDEPALPFDSQRIARDCMAILRPRYYPENRSIARLYSTVGGTGSLCRGRNEREERLLSSGRWK
ncbi:hypothetical protein DDE82_006286 [Stemphylium lycopersici]|nr:hypothetical protein DDE82_006286 [Stemphylium lycopersici]